jgi:hypothetical protein
MSNRVKSDPFWYNDMSILIDSNRLTEFFPTKNQTLEERFNALVRLSLYCSIILYYYKKNYKYLSIFIGGLLITYFIYTNNPENDKRDTDIDKNNKGINTTQQSTQQKNTTKSNQKGIESLENDKNDKNVEECTLPTLDNPFMNVTMKDMLNIDPKKPGRPKACDITNPEVKQKMDEMFNHNLFKDVNDVFGKMNSQRQFYTMPNTTIPNAQDDFAKWLYLNPKTCKEDQDYCLRYEDVRAKRPVFVDPTKNPISSKK